jgi:hypothetical protein
MASVWDAAETLLAMAGGEVAALAAARELAVDCARAGRHAEARFWRLVADAITLETNPQPLIAPDLGPARGGAREGRPTRHRPMALPKHRANVLRFRRDLRELWERYAAESDRADKPKKEPE